MEFADDLFSEEFNEIVKQEYEETKECVLPGSTTSDIKVKTDPSDYYQYQPTESYDNKLIIHKEVEIEICDQFEKEIKRDEASNTINTKENIQKIDIEPQPVDKKKCKLFYCNFCDYSASKTPLLKTHMRVHGYDTFACKDCPFITDKFGRLTKHINVHTGQRRFHCPHCVFSIYSKSSFESHLKLHTEEKCQKSLKCTECSFVTDSRLRLKQHTESHTEKTAYNCNWCKYIGGSIKALRTHLTAHGLTKYTCNKCAFTNIRYERFKQHMAVHVRITYGKQSIYRKLTYKCDHCVYEASTKKLIRNHLKLHYCKGSIKTFNCKECSFVTTNPYRLNLHMTMHSGERPYACNWCDYTAVEHHDLLRHMNDHGLKEFTCKDCGFTTNHYSLLGKHLSKTHLMCDHCSYMTTRKLDLETHLKIHMEKKTFSIETFEPKIFMIGPVQIKLLI